MLAEHQAIIGLVDELVGAPAAVTAAAAGRALAAVFAVHLAKENELILPLLVAAPDVSLAHLLDGMHDLIGGHAEPNASPGGCGCGCGGNPDAGSAPASVLSIDPRLDVRDVPHAERHARVLAALDTLPDDGALVLVAPHAPRPLLAQIEDRYDGAFDVEWLQSGPDVWQLRLHRAPAGA